MPSSHHSILPEEYQEVEWLRGSTTQFCTTAYAPSVRPPTWMELIGDITIVNISNAKFAFGLTWTDDVQYSFGVTITGGKIYFYYGNSSSDTKNYKLSNWGTAPLNIHFELRADKIIINGTSYTRNVQLFPNTNNKMLIGKMSSDEAAQNTQVQIKHLKLYNKLSGPTGALITEIIPCYRISDGKAGFYQTNVPDGEANFITNEAEGNDWIIGPVVT